MKKTTVFSRCYLGIIGLLIIFSSCSENEQVQKSFPENGKGGVVYGGVFDMNNKSNFRSIYPHNITDASAVNLMGQVYEGLVEIDPETSEIIPGLAESWSLNEDNMTYTFKLQQGVYFHDDPCFPDGKGREVKAADIKYCLDMLCTPSENNKLFSFVIDKIKGADAYYQNISKGGKPDPNGVPGIRVINDYEIAIELENPFLGFLKVLSHACSYIFPKEFVDYYGNDINEYCVGTGPFKAKKVKLGDVVILERNSSYWQLDSLGNNLPFLNAIRCTFIKDEQVEYQEFLKGNLDIIDELSSRSIAEAAINSGENVNYYVLTKGALLIQYYGFQHDSEIFSDQRVREAFNIAVDKQFIVDSLLKGYAEPANHGFVPPGMPDYPSEKVEGLQYNPARAQKLLAEAGYPGGDGLPVLTLQLDDANTTNISIGVIVQKMLGENLGVTIELSVSPKEQHYDMVESGQVLFWKDNWIADYTDPENFLRLFYSPSNPEDNTQNNYLNSVRYQNPAFDRLFKDAQLTADPEKRVEDFVKADQLIINESVVLPLFYQNWVLLVRKNVRNLHLNNLNRINLKSVYFSDANLTQN